VNPKTLHLCVINGAICCLKCCLINNKLGVIDRNKKIYVTHSEKDHNVMFNRQKLKNVISYHERLATRFVNRVRKSLVGKRFSEIYAPDTKREMNVPDHMGGIVE